MRKLKLQMTVSLDGKWDQGMWDFCVENLSNADCILHGRKTAEEFIPYWTKVANNPHDNDYIIGKLLTEIPNVVLTNTIEASKWDNATLIHGDISEAVTALKNKSGKDIIAYGGHSFVSSLARYDLIDEYYLLVNPVALGDGKQAFNPLHHSPELQLVECRPFTCGAVLLHYTK